MKNNFLYFLVVINCLLNTTSLHAMDLGSQLNNLQANLGMLKGKLGQLKGALTTLKGKLEVDKQEKEPTLEDAVEKVEAEQIWAPLSEDDYNQAYQKINNFVIPPGKLALEMNKKNAKTILPKLKSILSQHNSGYIVQKIEMNKSTDYEDQITTMIKEISGLGLENDAELKKTMLALNFIKKIFEKKSELDAGKKQKIQQAQEQKLLAEEIEKAKQKAVEDATKNAGKVIELKNLITTIKNLGNNWKNDLENIRKTFSLNRQAFELLDDNEKQFFKDTFNTLSLNDLSKIPSKANQGTLKTQLLTVVGLNVDFLEKELGLVIQRDYKGEIRDPEIKQAYEKQKGPSKQPSKIEEGADRPYKAKNITILKKREKYAAFITGKNEGYVLTEEDKKTLIEHYGPGVIENLTPEQQELLKKIIASDIEFFQKESDDSKALLNDLGLKPEPEPEPLAQPSGPIPPPPGPPPPPIKKK